MTTYIINAPVLTNYGDWRFEGPLSVAQASQVLQDGFVSAIGHEASANKIKRLLSIDISANRIHVALGVGDRALIFRLLQRLPEGKVLNDEELDSVPFELALLTRTA